MSQPRDQEERRLRVVLVTKDEARHDYEAPASAAESGALVSVFAYGAQVRVFRLRTIVRASDPLVFEEVAHTFVDEATLPRRAR